MGHAIERLEVIGTVLGRTHILLWRQKFFFIRGKEKKIRNPRALTSRVAYVNNWYINTGILYKNVPFHYAWINQAFGTNNLPIR